MGIYNCEKTLSDSIESIRNQTYTDWELIICDDGSNDKSLEIAKKFAIKDSRIIIIKNDMNCGLNITLNNCLKRATGNYIARMDADDISNPERFMKQISFLKSQEKYKIVSSSMLYFDENGIWGRNHIIKYPTCEDIIKGSPICHAPVMLKKECMDTVCGYTEDKKLLRVEDVDLWIKLYCAGYKCFNFEEPLYYMRNDKNALNRRKFKYRINSSYVRLLGCKKFNLGIKYYMYSLKPILYGIIPSKFRYFFKRFQNRKY